MKNILYPRRDQWSQILKRPTQTVKEIEATVNEVFNDVQINGDTAIKKYTKQFDKVSLSSFLVTQDEIKRAVQSVSNELKVAIQKAAGNIEKFHTNIYKVGGIQAISGLTFGTETIPKVYKIFGPGNQFVTVAKQLATKFGVAIDMPAGPSELLVMADESASEKLIEEVSSEVDMQLKELPRVEITTKAIQNSKSILVKDFKEALALINEYAPEHFIVCTKNNDFFIDGISNAGSVFIGNYTPESAGDYASGTNHTLPTNGYSKAYSGVNLDSFTKSITFQEITKTGIQNIGPSIELMAEAEGLQAHKNAVTLRLKDLK